MFEVRAYRQPRFLLQLLPVGLQVAQAIPNQAQNNRAQVGPKGVLVLPSPQNAEVVCPQVGIHLLHKIILKQPRRRRRRKDYGTEERVVACELRHRRKPRPIHRRVKPATKKDVSAEPHNHLLWLPLMPEAHQPRLHASTRDPSADPRANAPGSTVALGLVPQLSLPP